jgi:hypothetical protein
MEKYLDFIKQVGFINKPEDGEYYEKHHVIPKCLGGNNDKENLVWLKYKDHIKAHIILSDTYPDNVKLAFAVNAFVGFDRDTNVVINDEILSILEDAKKTFIKNHPAKNPEFAKKFSGENSPAKKNESTRLKLSKWNKENSIWRGKKRPEHSVAISGSKNGRSKKISTPFGIFDTIISASKELKMCRNLLAKLVKSSNPEYFLINSD